MNGELVWWLRTLHLDGRYRTRDAPMTHCLVGRLPGLLGDRRFTRQRDARYRGGALGYRQSFYDERPLRNAKRVGFVLHARTKKLSSSQPTDSPYRRTLSRVCSNAWFSLLVGLFFVFAGTARWRATYESASGIALQNRPPLPGHALIHSLRRSGHTASIRNRPPTNTPDDKPARSHLAA